MRCEIEIDLGPLADEWEPLAFRKPIGKEPFIADDGSLIGSDRVSGIDYGGPRLIVRRRWVWPKWLTAEWYCEDERGQYAGYGEPTLHSCQGSDWWELRTCDNWLRISEITSVSRIGGDWRQSKRRNPNAKERT